MNAALITPFYHPPVRGNAVTVDRIARHLAAVGCTVRVHALDATLAEEVMREVRQSPPDIVHAFHAYLGGRVAREAARAAGVPYVVTLTGSDVYEALEDGRRADTLEVLRDAAAIVAFHKCVRCRLSDHHPSLAGKTVVIPQGVEPPGEKFQWGGECFDGGEVVFFLPAGIRPVKNVTFPLSPLAELHREAPQVRLLVAGPILDLAYSARALSEIERNPFARYLGEVGREAIGALYCRADVVLNTSQFEGGMANSVLEALAFGKPVLASFIDGNISVVKEGKTGLLYRGEAEFLEKARMLVRDESLRWHLGANGRQLVREQYAPGREAAAYEALYRTVVTKAD